MMWITMKRAGLFIPLLCLLAAGCSNSPRATAGAPESLQGRQLFVADVRLSDPIGSSPPVSSPIASTAVVSWPVVSSVSATTAPAVPASEAPSVVASRPEDPLPIPLIELRGDAAEMGRQHGAALRDRILTLKARYLDLRLANSNALKLIAYAGAAMFEAKMAAEHHDEIQAMADASGLERRTAMLAQCFLDLTDMVACSTVSFPAAASPDGVPRMGRNLDFPGLNVLDSMSAVLIFHPTDGRYQFAAITWPGLAGVLSGMNEHGLVLCNMEVTRAPRLPSAMPYILLYRTVLERCRDVDEAIDLLRSTPRQSANNIMLMDAAGNRAVVEITPDSIAVRRGADDAALISTNHQRGQDTATPGRCRRYDYLHDTSATEFGNIGVEQIEHMLAGAAQGKWSLQSMVFEPGTRVIYLATGTKAPTKRFYRIDLKRHFDPSVESQ